MALSNPLAFSTQKNLLLAAVLFLLTLLAYFPVFSNGFVYDDHFQLLKNPYIRDVSHIPTLFTSDVWHFSESTRSNNYRPLHLLVYLIIYQFAGFDPFYYHTLNFLLHLACVFLLWFVAQHHLRGAGAFLAALLFATHPVHVEPVAWIGGTPEVLHGALLLGAYLFFLHRKLSLCVLLFAGAIFTKEPALMFPLVLMTDQILYKRHDNKTFLITSAGCLLMIAIYTAMRINALGSFLQPNQAGLGALETIQTALSFAGLYIQRVVLPIDLKVFYHFSLPLEQQTVTTGWLILAAALLLILLARKNKTVLFGASWFTIFLAPALFVTGVSPVLFAERYVYLPSAGILLAIAAAEVRRPITLLVCVLAVVFAFISLQRARVWHDDLRLWTQSVLDSPRSATANYNLATAHLQSRSWARAARYYQYTLKLDPKRVEAYYNLAVCQHALGNYEEAMKNLSLFLQYWRGDEKIKMDAQKKLRELEQRKD